MTPTQLLDDTSLNSIQVRPVFIPRPGNSSPKASVIDAPMLALTVDASFEVNIGSRKHFLVPKSNNCIGEEYDLESESKPSPLCDLPPLEETISRYVLGLVEIWGGRRQPMQLARMSHRLVYATILDMAGTHKEIPRIRKLYISEPIEGVAETAVTLRFKERVRSLVLRFEGADRRWLCTEMTLL